MIVQERLETNLVKTYSDTGMMIQQETGGAVRRGGGHRGIAHLRRNRHSG